MNTQNLFSQQQPGYLNNIGSYYPYTYQQPLQRTEMPNYPVQQAMPAGLIKGRPVASLEEARVAQIDLDGSVFFFPDLGNKKVYTKRINADGTATLSTYTLDESAVPVEDPYVTKSEFDKVREALEIITAKLTGANPGPQAAPKPQSPQLNF